MEQLWRVFGDVIPAVLVGLPVAALAMWGLTAWRIRRLERREAWQRSLLDVLLIAAAVPVMYIVFIPAIAWGPTPVSLVPGADLFPIDDTASLWQLAGNLVLLVPLGMLAPLRWPALRSARRLLLAILAVACGIEIGQWLLDVGRVVSTDDVLVNSVGGMLGAGLSRFWWSRNQVVSDAAATNPVA